MEFEFNEKFTDENAACLIIEKNINVMLLRKEFFKTFTQKTICDSQLNTEVILAIGLDDKKQVDELWNKAMDAGAGKARDTEDHGWMYARSFEDPDGHIWEVFWMNENEKPQH
jgi:uncharacterized protein